LPFGYVKAWLTLDIYTVIRLYLKTGRYRAEKIKQNI
jgi:hypothetical protein